MEELLNNFTYAEELDLNPSTSEEKLILVSAVQLLLNYWQEHLFVKNCIYSKKKLQHLSCLARDIWNFPQYFKIKKFLCIPRFLAELITVFCETLVGKHCLRGSAVSVTKNA